MTAAELAARLRETADWLDKIARGQSFRALVEEWEARASAVREAADQLDPPLPCGHPAKAAVQAGEGTAYCGECAPGGGGGET